MHSSSLCGDAVVNELTGDAVVNKLSVMLLYKSIAHTITVVGYTIEVCISTLCDIHTMTKSLNNIFFIMYPHQ